MIHSSNDGTNWDPRVFDFQPSSRKEGTPARRQKSKGEFGKCKSGFSGIRKKLSNCRTSKEVQYADSRYCPHSVGCVLDHGSKRCGSRENQNLGQVRSRYVQCCRTCPLQSEF